MRGIVIDTNVLLLLLVGSYDPRCIEGHRRLSTRYSVSDFDKLTSFLANYDRLVVVPSSLSEISNLISYSDDPVSTGIKLSFCAFVREALEVYSPSAKIIETNEFRWLGLSDAAQIQAAERDDHVLLTVDGPLYAAALQRGVQALHFSAL